MSSPAIATLIGRPGALTPQLMRVAAAHALDVTILAPATACDVHLADDGAALRDALADAPLDIVVQPAEGRRKAVLIADMDSTMIEQECIDELAAEAGVGGRVAALTARAMRGELDFEAAQRERVALMEGLEEAAIARVLERRVTLAAGGKALVSTMRAHGAWTALVSGGFTAFTGPVAEHLGFDEHRANVLEIEGGRLAGHVREPILGADAKVEALHDIVARCGCTSEDVLAVGDGANDLGMLAAAGTGVAMHAKPIVAERARHRIDHGDLTALLYLQGYAREDFA